MSRKRVLFWCVVPVIIGGGYAIYRRARKPS
jgi:hypothetical protein